MSEQPLPMTLQDLFVVERDDLIEGPRLRSATLADLVSALRAEGMLVVEKDSDRQDWPSWAFDAMGVKRFGVAIERPYRGLLLDALAEAQSERPNA